MHSLNRTKTLPFAPEFIRDIILDVEKYPEFLPWCKYVKIITQEDDIFTADMIVSFNGFQEKYTSEIKHTENNEIYIINVEAINGPFKFLKNNWYIAKPLQHQTAEESINTKVQFHIEFEFKSKILDKIVGMFFETATNKMIDAFETRANKVNSQMRKF